jgi:hypothetical protein
MNPAGYVRSRGCVTSLNHKAITSPGLLRIALRCSAPTPNQEEEIFEGTPLELPAHGLRPRYPCFGR